jgi:hypothetical protein
MGGESVGSPQLLTADARGAYPKSANYPLRYQRRGVRLRHRSNTFADIDIVLSTHNSNIKSRVANQC